MGRFLRRQEEKQPWAEWISSSVLSGVKGTAQVTIRDSWGVQHRSQLGTVGSHWMKEFWCCGFCIFLWIRSLLTVTWITLRNVEREWTGEYSSIARECQHSTQSPGTWRHWSAGVWAFPGEEKETWWLLQGWDREAQTGWVISSTLKSHGFHAELGVGKE